MLGQASDNSLEKLAQPGGFYDDPAVRISFPPIEGDLHRETGITTKFLRQLNEAAGIVAGRAKPIFRSAIGKLATAEVSDQGPQTDNVVSHLQRSATPHLRERLRPLVDMALMRSGAMAEFDRLIDASKILRSAGMTRDRLGDSVTDQMLAGMFRYIAAEENRLRAGPLATAGGLLAAGPSRG